MKNQFMSLKQITLALALVGGVVGGTSFSPVYGAQPKAAVAFDAQKEINAFFDAQKVAFSNNVDITADKPLYNGMIQAAQDFASKFSKHADKAKYELVVVKATDDFLTFAKKSVVEKVEKHAIPQAKYQAVAREYNNFLNAFGLNVFKSVYSGMETSRKLNEFFGKNNNQYINVNADFKVLAQELKKAATSIDTIVTSDLDKRADELAKAQKALDDKIDLKVQEAKDEKATEASVLAKDKDLAQAKIELEKQAALLKEVKDALALNADQKSIWTTTAGIAKPFLVSTAKASVGTLALIAAAVYGDAYFGGSTDEINYGVMLGASAACGLAVNGLRAAYNALPVGK